MINIEREKTPEDINSYEEKNEKKFALTIEDLPPLKEGFGRVVHITNSEYAQEIAKTGLNYEKYGMLQSTARAYGNVEEVEYGSDDPRFSFEGAKAVVFDIPIADLRRHNDVTKSPGILSSEYLVGIVDVVNKEKRKN